MISSKPSSNKFRVNFKEKLSDANRNRLIEAIQKVPQYSRYYHLQGNDWYQIRSPKNQDVKNPSDIEILLKNEYMLIMKSIDDKNCWSKLEYIQDHLGDDF